MSEKWHYEEKKTKGSRFKLSRKLLAVACILCFLGGIGGGMALHTIYSAVKSASLKDYTLDLNTTENGLQVTLTATLYDPNNVTVPAKTVTFYQTDAVGNVTTTIGTAVTNGAGIAQKTWNATDPGTYYFKASCDVPP